MRSAPRISPGNPRSSLRSRIAGTPRAGKAGGALAACAAVVLLLACAAGSWAQKPEDALRTKVLASGLSKPTGVAIHPVTGDIYVSELGAGRIVKVGGGDALAPGWEMNAALPKWAVKEGMSLEDWLKASLDQPGSISISTNGILYVAEQKPNGRVIGFVPDAEKGGAWNMGTAIPIPWLDQEFQWRQVTVDGYGRLYVAGTDEIGNTFMQLGSCLVRDLNGDWWVVDHGPFAQFTCFTMSGQDDFMVLGDRREGTLAWWELEKHLMLGGSPSTTEKGHELKALSIHPSGAFVLGIENSKAGTAQLMRMDPHTQQKSMMLTGLKSIGAIALDRKNGRYIVTDPVAGQVIECTFPTQPRFTDSSIKQIMRSAAMFSGLSGAAEAPAFLNNFIERLTQAASHEFSDEDATHAVDFNISDIAGKLPIVAGRIRAAAEIVGVEDDPIETVEFFILFPSKMVLTEDSVTPSLSFFTATRKSGKMEQTRSLFTNDVTVKRLAGTNISTVATAAGGLQVPITVCGLSEEDGGIAVELSFLGMGIYNDYFLHLYQGPRDRTARLTVPTSTEESGFYTYEASFMDEATIEGMGGVKHKEEISNLLIAGFESGGGANRSVGWLHIGQYPASMLVGFGDAEVQLTGAAAEMKDLVESKRVSSMMEGDQGAGEVVGAESGEAQ